MNVLLPGVAKSTWKYQKCSTGVGLPSQFGWPVATIGFGSPPAAAFRPSRSVGQRRELVGIHVEGDRRRRVSRHHRRAVERRGAGVAEGAARELVRRHVVGVRPDAPLRVVRNVERVREVVAVVAARRVAGLRNRHADVELVLDEDVEGDAAHHPAVRELVVLHDRVGHVLGLAEAAEAREERGARQRADDVVPVRLVVDVEDRVDELEVLRRADGTLGVRRGDREAEERTHLRGRRAFEVEDRSSAGSIPKCRCTTVSTPLCSTPRIRGPLVSRRLVPAPAERLRRRMHEAQRARRVVLDRMNHARRRRRILGSRFLSAQECGRTEEEGRREHRGGEGKEPFRQARLHGGPPF